MDLIHMLLLWLVTALLGRWILRWPSALKLPAFATLNVAAIYIAFFRNVDPRLTACYALAILGQYTLIRQSKSRHSGLVWLAFFVPILFLCAARYIPPSILASLSHQIADKLQKNPEWNPGALLVGLSYVAFRVSRLVIECRNGEVPLPTFWQYVSFAFYFPTFSVGPISTFAQFSKGLNQDIRNTMPWSTCTQRIMVGAVKAYFIAPILNQLTYSEFLLDGFTHPLWHLPVAAFAYYFYLYANFSGFCDIAIGVAGIMGISVPENFENPLVARNIKDFWNKWHITLSSWMRDILFSPLSKQMVRTLGPANANHAIAITILVVFVLVGIWHGAGWNFVIFGTLHAVGLIANHYYTVWLKVTLGKARFAPYMQSRLVHSLGTIVTACYVTFTLAFFANDLKSLAQILQVLN